MVLSTIGRATAPALHAGAVALKISFLHQGLILTRHQMRLNLRHGIHDYDHYDQQGCTTQIERYIRPHHQELGQQAYWS